MAVRCALLNLNNNDKPIVIPLADERGVCRGVYR